MIAGLISGLVWFAIFLFGQLIVMGQCDALVRPRATNLIFVGCVAGLAISVVLICQFLEDSVVTHGGGSLAVLWGLLTLVCLFVLYMPFYYTVASSLSVRTLVLLAAEPGGRLPIDEVRERFVSPALVGRRLEIMKTNGFLAATEDGGFVLTSKGRALATVFGQLKRFWGMDAGG
jgi:hypothetical protein